MEKDNNAELAWALHKAIENNEMERRSLLFANMKLLNGLYSKGLYKIILGDENAQWSSYLSQHEVFYSRNKVFTMNRIFQKFIIELKLSVQEIFSIPITKLDSLLTVVTKDNVQDWLTKAQSLTNQDFNDELRIAQGKESYLNCEHSDEKTFKVCAKCGNRHQI